MADVYAALTPEAPPEPTEYGGEQLPVSTLSSKGRLSLPAMNLAKVMLGVAILALPKVTAMLGIGTTLIFLFLMAFLTTLSLHYMTLASARSGHLRYSDVARHYTGLGGQVLLDMSLIVNSGGMLCVAYVVLGDILVGSTIHDSGLLSRACGDRATVLAVLTVLILAPLVSVVHPRTLAGFSGLGVAAIIFWSIITILLFVVALTNGTLHTMKWWPQGESVGHGLHAVIQVASTLPILVVAFICQQSLQHVMADLQRERQVDTVSGMALGISAAVFLAIGGGAYGLFGSQVEADVLNNFTIDALQPLVWTKLAHAVFLAVRLSFWVSLVAIFPLHMVPLRDAFWKLFFRQNLQGPGLWIVTYILLAVLYFLGTWINSIWEPLIVIGSTAGVFLAFIMPGLLAIKLPSRLTDSEGAAAGRVAGGAALILVGLILTVFGIMRIVMYGE